MHFKTNQDLIQKQKNFILNILEKEEGINPNQVIFSEVECIPLPELDPIHHGEEKNLNQIINAFSQGIAFPPILVDKQKKILMDGNHRYLASERLNYSHILVLFYSIKKTRY